MWGCCWYTFITEFKYFGVVGDGGAREAGCVGEPRVGGTESSQK